MHIAYEKSAHTGIRRKSPPVLVKTAWQEPQLSKVPVMIQQKKKDLVAAILTPPQKKRPRHVPKKKKTSFVLLRKPAPFYLSCPQQRHHHNFSQETVVDISHHAGLAYGGDTSDPLLFPSLLMGGDGVAAYDIAQSVRGEHHVTFVGTPMVENNRTSHQNLSQVQHTPTPVPSIRFTEDRICYEAMVCEVVLVRPSLFAESVGGDHDDGQDGHSLFFYDEMDGDDEEDMSTPLADMDHDAMLLEETYARVQALSEEADLWDDVLVDQMDGSEDEYHGGDVREEIDASASEDEVSEGEMSEDEELEYAERANVFTQEDVASIDMQGEEVDGAGHAGEGTEVAALHEQEETAARRIQSWWRERRRSRVQATMRQYALNTLAQPHGEALASGSLERLDDVTHEVLPSETFGPEESQHSLRQRTYSDSALDRWAYACMIDWERQQTPPPSHYGSSDSLESLNPDVLARVNQNQYYVNYQDLISDDEYEWDDSLPAYFGASHFNDPVSPPYYDEPWTFSDPESESEDDQSRDVHEGTRVFRGFSSPVVPLERAAAPPSPDMGAMPVLGPRAERQVESVPSTPLLEPLLGEEVPLQAPVIPPNTEEETIAEGDINRAEEDVHTDIASGVAEALVTEHQMGQALAAQVQMIQATLGHEVFDVSPPLSPLTSSDEGLGSPERLGPVPHEDPVPDEDTSLPRLPEEGLLNCFPIEGVHNLLVEPADVVEACAQRRDSAGSVPVLIEVGPSSQRDSGIFEDRVSSPDPWPGDAVLVAPLCQEQESEVSEVSLATGSTESIGGVRTVTRRRRRREGPHVRQRTGLSDYAAGNAARRREAEARRAQRQEDMLQDGQSRQLNAQHVRENQRAQAQAERHRITQERQERARRNREAQGAGPRSVTSRTRRDDRRTDRERYQGSGGVSAGDPDFSHTPNPRRRP